MNECNICELFINLLLSFENFLQHNVGFYGVVFNHSEKKQFPIILVFSMEYLVSFFHTVQPDFHRYT